MTVILNRLREASTWARFGHSLFVLAWFPTVPHAAAGWLIAASVASLAISACIPDPKP